MRKIQLNHGVCLHIENTNKLALIFGNEGSGVSEEMLNLSDDNIFIEMNRFESLNVAMACGICCYYFRQM
mgnify:CR=1 FL=1